MVSHSFDTASQCAHTHTLLNRSSIHSHQSQPPAFILRRVDLNAPWGNAARVAHSHTQRYKSLTLLKIHTVFTLTGNCRHTRFAFSHTNSSQLLTLTHTHSLTHGDQGSNDIQALTHFTHLFSAPSLWGLPFIPAGYTGCHTGSWGSGTKTWIPVCACVYVWIFPATDAVTEGNSVFVYGPTGVCQPVYNTCIFTWTVFMYNLTEKDILLCVIFTVYTLWFL